MGPISKSFFVLVFVYHTNLHTVLDPICIEVREACIDGYDGNCVYTLGATLFGYLSKDSDI